MTLIDERPTAPDHDEVQALFREARRRRRRRWMVGSLVLAVTLATIAAAVLIRRSSTTRSPGQTMTGSVQNTTSALPAEVVVWEHFRLDVLSSLDGHRIRTLATDVGEFRGSPSLSVAPGGTVYFDNHAYVGSSPVDRIDRIPVSGGDPSYVADGRTPAVSPDGRLLAYVTNDPVAGAAFEESITIEDLRSHAIRSWTAMARQADLWALSWAPDSRSLSFSETASTSPNSLATSYWVLDTTGTVLTSGAAHRLTLAPGVSWDCFMAGTRPGGLVGVGEVQLRNGLRLIVVNARSGRTTRSLVTIPNASDATVQADASGKHLIVAASGSGSFGFGRLFRWTSGSAKPTALAPGVLVAAWVPTASTK